MEFPTRYSGDRSLAFTPTPRRMGLQGRNSLMFATEMDIAIVAKVGYQAAGLANSIN